MVRRPHRVLRICDASPRIFPEGGKFLVSADLQERDPVTRRLRLPFLDCHQFTLGPWHQAFFEVQLVVTAAFKAFPFKLQVFL